MFCFLCLKRENQKWWTEQNIKQYHWIEDKKKKAFWFLTTQIITVFREMILYFSATEENELHKGMVEEWWLFSGKPLGPWLFYNRMTLGEKSQQCMHKAQRDE